MGADLVSKVIGIVAAVKQVPPESVHAESTFEELGIDSLDRINILFELENEFNVDVPDEVARSITSVSGIIENLSAYVERGQSAAD